MRGFLERGPEALERLAGRLGPGGRALDPGSLAPGTAPRLSQVTLAPLVPDPRKLICIGLNYRDHAAETQQAIPEVPTVFAKYPNVLIGAGAPIVIPRVSSKVDYEAELAFVIGRRARYVTESEALRYVAGYTCFNDVTARDLQKLTPQWTLGKSCDTFGPLGPALVTPDELPDPQALAIRLTVDGETLQDSSTSGMIFTVARLVSYLSLAMTLEPGDVVSTGTPAGVGFVRDPPRFLQPGQTVRVEIERVGVLENPVVAEAPAA
jgi:2-keto-4-pentenoate hydratase/2-oxohepta-3-ene-1,7-dioic acid hydratase in catechol pathway